jgi:5S rRNA maturation endonuclease (ribonuclease M5)
MLIDSSQNKWRYTSGVIAFTESDNPSESEQSAVMTDFEMMAFAGLEREQYDILWVRHVHEGNVELHFVVPRLELTTGKALNIAPPGYQKTFDAWRDSWNYGKGWASPSDPARARSVKQDNYILKTDADSLRKGLPSAVDPKLEITNWLLQRVESGLIVDRLGIRASLSELGEITREGKDYISVKPVGFEKAVRLKGEIYGESFKCEDIVGKVGGEDGTGQETERSLDSGRAETARRALEKAVDRRTKFNQGRYRQNDAIFRRAATAVASGEQEADGITFVDDEIAIAGTPDCLPFGLLCDLGLLEADIPLRSDSVAEQVVSSDERRIVGELPNREFSTPVSPGESKSIWEKLRGFYDRTGKTIGRWIEDVVRAVRIGHGAAGNAERAIGRAGAEFVSASADLKPVIEQLERQTERIVGVVKMSRDTELERFKQEINLVEYAEVDGYKIDRRKSSRTSTVMRKGDDKIIVATDQDGHGIYFSVRDNADHGSIVDFVQNRSGLNLGHIRKQLRGWISVSSVQKRKPVDERPRKPMPSSADRHKVLCDWMKMGVQPTGGHPYLLEVRMLNAETLVDSRFVDMTRIDSYGNAVFPHYDRLGLAGYEIKNDGFTGFATGGTKAIWYSSNLKDAKRVVVVESAIDAMSHAELTDDKDAAYISVGGSMSEYQCNILRGLFAELSAKIIVATDNDAGGHNIAEQIGKLLPTGAMAVRQIPEYGKDWNEQLKGIRVDNKLSVHRLI